MDSVEGIITYLMSLAVTTFPLRTTRSNLLAIVYSFASEGLEEHLAFGLISAKYHSNSTSMLLSTQLSIYSGFPDRLPDRPIFRQGTGSKVLIFAEMPDLLLHVGVRVKILGLLAAWRLSCHRGIVRRSTDGNMLEILE